MSVEGEDSGTSDIDPDDGPVLNVTFSVKNGKLYVKMKFTLSNEYVHEEGTFTGYKS